MFSGGDLFDAITVAQKFSEDQASLMIAHLTSALAYLHNLNIVHRDVKPENLLVSAINLAQTSILKHLAVRTIFESLKGIICGNIEIPTTTNTV